jgi:hypothetical protein
VRSVGGTAKRLGRIGTITCGLPDCETPAAPRSKPIKLRLIPNTTTDTASPPQGLGVGTTESTVGMVRTLWGGGDAAKHPTARECPQRQGLYRHDYVRSLRIVSARLRAASPIITKCRHDYVRPRGSSNCVSDCVGTTACGLSCAWAALDEGSTTRRGLASNGPLIVPTRLRVAFRECLRQFKI